jgi:hypothetical protein
MDEWMVKWSIKDKKKMGWKKKRVPYVHKRINCHSHFFRGRETGEVEFLNHVMQLPSHGFVNVYQPSLAGNLKKNDDSDAIIQSRRQRDAHGIRTT